MSKKALNFDRASNYNQWYQDVIDAADLAEHSMSRGCMILKPWGYALWERCQKYLDESFKATGHQNVYFPLLIPLSCFEKEAEHISGFAKECAVVTHHRLKADENGKLIPDGKLEEPYIIRPTSEMIIGEAFSRWIQSYRDLPVLINQWANVMRWEMRTRLFLRTTEILWQEGHTAHATAKEALSETLQILDLYANFMHDVMAIAVIKGEKPAIERFPGAQNTYTIEALMQNGKALQAGTSHFMGQNFAHACDIRFSNKEGAQEHAWTTSWGVTTRLIGALIMTHSDDNGLVLPPKMSPYHIVILPILRNEETDQSILEYAQELKKHLLTCTWEQEPLRVHIDQRDRRGGEKNWEWIKKGVPLRIEIGLKELQNNQICLISRYPDANPIEKQFLKKDSILEYIQSALTSLQQGLLERSQSHIKKHTRFIDNLSDLETLTKGESEENAPGFLACYVADNKATENFLKTYNLTARCMPLDDQRRGTCLFSAEENAPLMLLAKAY